MRSKILAFPVVAVVLAVSASAAAPQSSVISNQWSVISNQSSVVSGQTSVVGKKEGGGDEGNLQRSTFNVQRPTETKLLFRVHFAGTKALMANTNAAYLTNFSALPETTALGEHIAARFATLPSRFFEQSRKQKAESTNAEGGDRRSEEGAVNSNQSSVISDQSSVIGKDETTARTNGVADSPIAKGDSLRPVFAELLREGFVLELRGGETVTEFAVAAKADAETGKRWEKAWRETMSGRRDQMSEGGGQGETVKSNQSSVSSDQWGQGRLEVKHTGDWFSVAGSKTDAAPALAKIQHSLTGPGLKTGNVLQAELGSRLLPGTIQRSRYGGFSRLEVSVTPADQSLKIRGTATYAQDLPNLDLPPSVPTNLVTDPAISFTMVRNPGAWLAEGSFLLRLLPNPTPAAAYFWGGESSPQQWFMAMPFENTNRFSEQFAPALEAELKPLAAAIDCGPVVFDRQRERIEWQGIPFFAPHVALRQVGGSHFVLAEVFPAPDLPPGLTPALLDRIAGRADLVLFDWEFLQARLQTWIRVGQLGLMLSGHNQLGGDTASATWIAAVPKTLPDGGNTTTEIIQSGPRELKLARRAPLAFTSIELFWLANWLESSNFPDANFLVPIKE